MYMDTQNVYILIHKLRNSILYISVLYAHYISHELYIIYVSYICYIN